MKSYNTRVKIIKHGNILLSFTWKRVWSTIKIDQHNVTIKLNRQWMGSLSLHRNISCTLFHISGPYHVLRVDDIYGDAQNEPFRGQAYFDMYIFDQTYDTEWGAGLPISLYAGNSCHSTEKYRLHMVENTRIDAIEQNDEIRQVVDTLNGLKYDLADKSLFTK